MNKWRTNRWLRPVSSEDGVGLILVIGMTMVLSAMVATALILTMNTLTQSSQRTRFEQALGAAEQGIDSTLARLQLAYDNAAQDYPIPGSPVCEGTAIEDPGGFATEEAEEAWAREQIQTLVDEHPECLQDGADGQYMVLKPETPAVDGSYPGFGRVYSLGWSPSMANPTSSRLVKAEYVFLPYQPGQAILTGGDLIIDSSTYVAAAEGYEDSSAGAHSNGVITVNGNPTVYGPVSSTGTSSASSASSDRFYSNEGGAVTTAPMVSIPTVNAAGYYARANPSDDVDWYDMCPDGSVRQYSGSTPCTGTVITDGDEEVGWSYDSGDNEWTLGRNSVDGAFYVHEADVNVGTGNATLANVTVIAGAQNPNDCTTKAYGNISWDHYDIQAPAIPNLFLYADSDISTHANFTAGNNGTNGSAVVSGMFIAGDQIDMQTSSQGATGSVISADQCTTSPLVEDSRIKNPFVYYDPTGDSPFTSIIRITLWLEY